MKVGLFDAGVGGFSILRSLETTFPSLDYVYLADRKNFPYYEKSKKSLQEIAKVNTRFLLHHGCDTVVVACNTATVNAIDTLKKHFSETNIIGVYPPIRKSVEMTKTGHIAVLSTPATQKSEYLTRLIDTHAKKYTVYNLSSPYLSLFIEAGHISSQKLLAELSLRLEPVQKHDLIDVLALGCTHYPFVALQMKKMLSPKVHIVDSANDVVDKVRYLMSPSREKELSVGEVCFYSTDNSAAVATTAGVLLHKPICVKMARL